VSIVDLQATIPPSSSSSLCSCVSKCLSLCLVVSVSAVSLSGEALGFPPDALRAPLPPLAAPARPLPRRLPSPMGKRRDRRHAVLGAGGRRMKLDLTNDDEVAIQGSRRSLALLSVSGGFRLLVF
jgi:hypothetical protein